jgi:small neutral amino acid transporter SnatA (MarC family)
MPYSLDTTLIGVMILSLIALLEPLTTVSFYARLHPTATPREYRKDGRRLGIVLFIAMIATFFLGQYMLAFFGLQTEYFRIAGAIILFFIAFSMVQGEEADATKINKVEWDHLIHEYLNKWLIVPLAFPLTFSAPGMAYVITMHSNGVLNGVIAITSVSVITALVVMYGGGLIQRLWEAGTHLIIRILWLFLMGVAIQTFGQMIFELIRQNGL